MTTAFASSLFQENLELAVRLLHTAIGVRSSEVIVSSTVGSAVLEAGPLSDILVDKDGSESLYLFLTGLLKGVIPATSSARSGRNQFLGQWRVPDSGFLDFNGELPYPTLFMRATSQEMDSSQSSSDWWTIRFEVQPVVDGFGDSWTAGTRAVEGDNESGLANLSFASIPVSYTHLTLPTIA